MSQLPTSEMAKLNVHDRDAPHAPTPRFNPVGET